MKKHLCGFFIALITFLVSFYVSPIRFIHDISGHGATSDLRYQCNFSKNASNHLSAVFRWNCNYENSETANKIFAEKAGNAVEIVESIKEIKLEDGKIIRRAIIKLYHENIPIYCLIRTDDKWFVEISSPSLRHVREYEEQRFKYQKPIQ